MNDPRQTRPRGDRGFTFLEMMLVITFLALFLGLVAPIAMSTLERMNRNTSLQQVATLMKTARSQAIALKAPFLFNASLENHTFWLADPRTEETFRVYALEDDIRFRSFTDGNAVVQEGLFAILFFPQGNNTGGVIELSPPRDKDDSTRYFIRLDPVTGRTEVGHVEG